MNGDGVPTKTLQIVSVAKGKRYTSLQAGRGRP